MLTTFYFIYLLDMHIAIPLDRPDVSLMCFSIGANCRSHVCANMYVLVCDGEKKKKLQLNQFGIWKQMKEKTRCSKIKVADNRTDEKALLQ